MVADKRLFYLSCILITIGIVFSYSLTAFTVLFLDYSEFHFLFVSFFGISGILIMFFISRLDPDKALSKKIILAILIVSFIFIIILPFYLLY